MGSWTVTRSSFSITLSTSRFNHLFAFFTPAAAARKAEAAEHTRRPSAARAARNLLSTIWLECSAWIGLIGVGVVFVFLVAATILFLKDVADRILFPQDSFPSAAMRDSAFREEIGSSLLVPVIPGLTLSISYLPHFLLAAFISLAVHEFGHGMVAAMNGVSVLSCGVQLWLFCIPAAFVALDDNELLRLHPKRRSQVYSAGILHNLVIASLAVVVLAAMPLILYPIFAVGRGCVVLDASSMLRLPPYGLERGDIIVSMNDFPTLTLPAFRDAVAEVLGAARDPDSGSDFVSVEISFLRWGTDDHVRATKQLSSTFILEYQVAQHLLSTVSLSGFVPRGRLARFSWMYLFPDHWATFLTLLGGSSTGLATVNLIAATGLDGFHILHAAFVWVSEIAHMENRRSLTRFWSVFRHLTTAATVCSVVLLGGSMVPTVIWLAFNSHRA